MPLAACTILYGVLLGIEEYAIARMDVFIDIVSIEQAEVTAIAMNSIFECLRLGLIGVAVWLLLRALRQNATADVRPTFLGVWSMGCRRSEFSRTGHHRQLARIRASS